METLVWVLHVGAAIGIIGLVLIQHGKGADMGAAFGSGSAGGLFGASGAANFLSRS
ncbi:MAG: preprotein translocase subunit SecG, partial [Betaproteobacteria bacterium]|nr:preprotein translocase subunit SecG [Betaproteobacteria bacterium]